MLKNDKFYLDELWGFVLSLDDAHLEALGKEKLDKLLKILKRYGMGKTKIVKRIEAIIKKIEEEFLEKTSKKIDDKLGDVLAQKNKISLNLNSK